MSSLAWRVAYNPTWESLRYSFFLSYVSEDHAEIEQLRNAIVEEQRKRGGNQLRPFFAVHDFPAATPVAPVLRDAMINSGFLLLWVTPNFLNSKRGWVWMELTLGQLIEDSLNARQMGLVLPFVLTVFRNIRSARSIQRTPLHDYWMRPVMPADKESDTREVAKKLIDLLEIQSVRRSFHDANE